MGLWLTTSSRLLTTRALPAVRFVLVKPKSTQKPMKSTSTKTVLERSPWSVPITICTASVMPALLSALVEDRALDSRPARAGLLPWRDARAYGAAACLDRLRNARARHVAAVWLAAPRHRRTRNDFRWE